jgi:DNA-binding MarR family transcriptional regulator
MAEPAEDYYDVWISMLGRNSRPAFLSLLLDRAGVSLDIRLATCLVNVELHGPIGVLDLAELLDQNHPKVSRTLARLEALGLVSRRPAAHDRRIKTAVVTPKGRRTVEAINRGRRRLLEDALRDWSDRDRATLARLNRRFSDRIAELIEEHGAGASSSGDNST